MTTNKPDKLWLLIIILLVAVIAAGSVIACSRYGQSQPIEISISPSQELQGEIYIGGAVCNPGVYSLKAGDSLEAQKAELETQIKASQETAISLPKLERFIDLMRQKLSVLDFETKRLALEMLNIKVWIDGHDIEITGTLPIVEDAIVTTQSW